MASRRRRPSRCALEDEIRRKLAGHLCPKQVTVVEAQTQIPVVKHKALKFWIQTPNTGADVYNNTHLHPIARNNAAAKNKLLMSGSIPEMNVQISTTTAWIVYAAIALISLAIALYFQVR